MNWKALGLAIISMIGIVVALIGIVVAIVWGFNHYFYYTLVILGIVIVSPYTILFYQYYKETY